MRFFSKILLLISVSFFLMGCSQKEQPAIHSSSKKISVVATFYPLAYLAENIGKEFIEVKNMTPIGIDVHDVELSPREVQTVLNADLFIIQGVGIDIWAEKLQGEREKSKRTNLLLIKENELIPLLPLAEEHREEGHEEDHTSPLDPHIWLDPSLYSHFADQITSSLIEIDPSHEEIYRKNLTEIKNQLEILDQEIKRDLSACATKQNAIVSHNAFSYFGKRYNIHFEPIAGLDPHEEPSLSHVAKIIDHIKQNNIQTVFQETSGSWDLMKMLEQQTDVKILPLHSLETLSQKETESQETYFTLMRQNKNYLLEGICIK